ncbi:hypothetical protein HPB47_019029 [Ixodes persulcatus]|uniref:Uncharacterized protein n=1 Tax=Ixodes persulcatus TaxID=34615 RepID=A0AC60QLS4_IXOPE|nr:hypothetical protein HPB47_019029 [Ixodes persulcatus]
MKVMNLALGSEPRSLRKSEGLAERDLPHQRKTRRRPGAKSGGFLVCRRRVGKTGCQDRGAKTCPVTKGGKISRRLNRCSKASGECSWSSGPARWILERLRCERAAGRVVAVGGSVRPSGDAPHRTREPAGGQLPGVGTCTDAWRGLARKPPKKGILFGFWLVKRACQALFLNLPHALALPAPPIDQTLYIYGSDGASGVAAAMQQGGSSRASAGRLANVPRKLWRSRAKSQSRVSALSVCTWSPEGSCRWRCRTGGRLTLRPTSLVALTEAEAAGLRPLAISRLQGLGLGCKVDTPREDSSETSAKVRRRPALLRKKAITTSFFESRKESDIPSGQVFGVPLQQVLQSDQQRFPDATLADPDWAAPDWGSDAAAAAADALSRRSDDASESSVSSLVDLASPDLRKVRLSSAAMERAGAGSSRDTLQLEHYIAPMEKSNAIF